MSSSQPVLGILENALEYLESAADNLVANTPASRKYALLHVFAAIELLLKEKLAREHWALLFAEVNKAKREALQSGDFKSVDFDTCVIRLSEIAGVTLDKNRKTQLDRLRTLRNRLQHFHNVMDEAEAVSRLAHAFGFVVDFIASELPDVQKSHPQSLDVVHEKLTSFSAYVSERLAEVRLQIEAAKTTVTCPKCEQETLILGSGNPRCPFCGYTDEPWEAMTAAVGDGVVSDCPSCGGMMGCYDVNDNGKIIEELVCFMCGCVGHRP
jgi:hypothetical protein